MKKYAQCEIEGEVTPSGKISLDQMRSIWNDDREVFTEEELLQIRDWLYAMADIIIEQMQQDRQADRFEVKPVHVNDRPDSPYVAAA